MGSHQGTTPFHEGSLHEARWDQQHPQDEHPQQGVRGTATTPVPTTPALSGLFGGLEAPWAPWATKSPRLAPASAGPGEELVVDSRHSPAQMGLNYLKCFSRELALAV